MNDQQTYPVTIIITETTEPALSIDVLKHRIGRPTAVEPEPHVEIEYLNYERKRYIAVILSPSMIRAAEQLHEAICAADSIEAAYKDRSQTVRDAEAHLW